MVYLVKSSASIKRSHVSNEQCYPELTMFPDNFTRSSNIYLLIILSQVKHIVHAVEKQE